MLLICELNNYFLSNEFIEDINKQIKCMMLKNKNFEVYYNLGNLFFKLGKTRQAYYFFKKSNNLNSGHKVTSK
mgnify:CR=1 FL=1